LGEGIAAGEGTVVAMAKLGRTILVGTGFGRPIGSNAVAVLDPPAVEVACRWRLGCSDGGRRWRFDGAGSVAIAPGKRSVRASPRFRPAGRARGDELSEVCGHHLAVENALAFQEACFPHRRRRRCLYGAGAV